MVAAEWGGAMSAWFCRVYTPDSIPTRKGFGSRDALTPFHLRSLPSTKPFKQEGNPPKKILYCAVVCTGPPARPPLRHVAPPGCPRPPSAS